MSDIDPWDGQAGPLMWSITDTVLDLLDDGEPHHEHDIINATGANPTTASNVIYALARFGAIYRGGTRKKHTLRITPLGRQWRSSR